MSIKLSTILGASLVVSLSACTGSNATAAKPSAKTEYVKTAKPVAAVDISHDYDGTLAAGETREITIKVTDGYASGLLRLDLLPNENLVVESASNSYQFNMADNTAHEFTISVKALTEGVHYLNINAIAEYDNQQVSRINSAIALNAGVVMPKGGPEAIDIPDTDQAEGGLVIMEASEEIIVNTPDEN